MDRVSSEFNAVNGRLTYLFDRVEHNEKTAVPEIRAAANEALAAIDSLHTYLTPGQTTLKTTFVFLSSTT